MKQVLFKSIILVAVMSCVACLPKGPASHYQHFYESHLSGFQPPSIDSVRGADLSESKIGWEEILESPMESVWRACIYVGVQYWGILDLAEEAGGVRRMVLIPPGPTKRVGRNLRKPVDRWLAVALTEMDQKTTKVSLAWVRPDDGGATRIPDMTLDSGKVRRSEDDQQFIARSLSSRFLNDVKAVLVPEEVYFNRFPSAFPSRPPRGQMPAEEGRKRLKRADLIQQWGYLESASIRRNHVVLDYPELGARIAEIVERLTRAACPWSRVQDVYFLSSDNDNARITANGDLFLSLGVFEATESVDELAGLIAHELAHLCQGDHLDKQKRFQRTRRSAKRVAIVTSIGGAIASGMFDSPEEPTSLADVRESLLTTEEVLVGAALTFVGIYVAPNLFGNASLMMGDELAGKYNQEQEIRADEFATEYLWYAGYRHDGLLCYFARKDFQDVDGCSATVPSEKGRRDDG